MKGTAPEDAWLCLGRDMAEAELRDLARGQVALYSARSPDKDSENEDAAAVIPLADGAVVLAVADGVGGGREGERAARLSVRALASSLRRAEESETLRSAILDGVEQAQQAVLGLGGGAATTFAAVEIRGATARPYHVGDSEILIVGQRGRVKLEIVSHSPVGFAMAAGVLDEAEAMSHEQRHVVSNVLGAADMRVEVGSALPLSRFDTVLLATDGLFDNLRREEIVAHVRKGPLREALGSLADAARRRMTLPVEGEPSKPDDLTLVAFRPGRSGV